VVATTAEDCLKIHRTKGPLTSGGMFTSGSSDCTNKTDFDS